MGLAKIDIDAVAGTAAFPHDPADDHPHQGGVGDAPADALRWIGGLARLTPDAAFRLGNAPQRNRLALPAVVPEDPVGLGDHHPALNVADLASALFALANLAAIEGGGEGLDLLGGERAGHGIEGMGGSGVRDQWAGALGGVSISTQQGGSLQWM